MKRFLLFSACLLIVGTSLTNAQSGSLGVCFAQQRREVNFCSSLYRLLGGANDYYSCIKKAYDEEKECEKETSVEVDKFKKPPRPKDSAFTGPSKAQREDIQDRKNAILAGKEKRRKAEEEERKKQASVPTPTSVPPPKSDLEKKDEKCKNEAKKTENGCLNEAEDSYSTWLDNCQKNYSDNAYILKSCLAQMKINYDNAKNRCGMIANNRYRLCMRSK